MAKPCVARPARAFPAFICSPPTPQRSQPSSANCVWMPKPTSTKPPWSCWACCLWREKWSPATPCSARRTFAPRCWKAVAIMSSRSKTISRSYTSTSPPCSPNRRTFPPYQQQRWESEQDCCTTVNKGHGRLEKRTLRTTPVLQSYLCEWPGIAQVFQLHRVRQLRDRVEEETVYGISSLPVGQADARRFQELVRGHWGIENRLHGVRDVTL